MDHLKSRLLWTGAGFLALIVVGTIGYRVLEGQNLADSLYMTVITLTAVGYREVFPLSPEGRAFTIFVLLAGISWLGLWFASLTSLIVELDLKDVIRRRRSMQDIANMKEHIIICGAGRTGRQVAQELEPVTQNYVVIERDPKRVEALKEYVPEAHVVEGDATHDHVLLEAGLMRAKGLISCLSADADNLYVCLSARELAASVKIVARAYEEESMAKLYRAGADNVVSPNVSSAIRMASVLLRPSVVSFLDIATRSSKLALRIEQAIVGEGSVIAGHTLGEARIPQETGLIVIAMRKRDADESDFVFNPSADTSIESGDEVIVLGETEQIEQLRAYLN
jgi:voltage-gated potassium channel